MPWRLATDIPYPGALPYDEGHRAFADPKMSTRDLYAFAEDWFSDSPDEPPDQTYYGIYVWHEPESVRLVRRKGAPANPIGPPTRTGPAPKTLRRWQHNARMQRVAQAQYPRASPEVAVERWWRHDGTMQPLRWSDAEVDQFTAEIRNAELERVAEEGGPHEEGDTLFVVTGTKAKLQTPEVKERERGLARGRYQRKMEHKAAEKGQVYRYKPKRSK